MPQEKLKDQRSPFDVYAMMLILSFVVIAGASFILNKDLDENWKFWVDPVKDPKGWAQAENITLKNYHPDTTEYVQVRAPDLEDVGKITGGAEFPVKGYEWPQDYKLDENPVKADVNNLETIPEEQIEKLMKTAKTAPEPAPGGAAAPTPAPAAPEGGAAAPAAAAPAPAAGAAPAVPAAPAAPVAPVAPAPVAPAPAK